MFYLLFLLFSIVNSEDCVCTTVMCPVVGENYIIMGNGNANVQYYYENHGTYNVVSKAYANISHYSLDNGSETTSCTQKYSRLLDDNTQECDAGHILANRLGGYGNQPLNIFPQNASINRGIYKEMEYQIYDCMIENNIGYLSWIFYYEDNNKTKPYKVDYQANFEFYCKEIYNSFSN